MFIAYVCLNLLYVSKKFTENLFLVWKKKHTSSMKHFTFVWKFAVFNYNESINTIDYNYVTQ